MISATAAQTSHRIDPAQRRNAVGTGKRQPRQDDDDQQPERRERRRRPARAASTAAPAPAQRRQREGRERQQPDARAVEAADGERALRQPRGDARQRARPRASTSASHVELPAFTEDPGALLECWTFYKVSAFATPPTASRAWRRRCAAAVLMTWPLATGLGHLGRTQNSGDGRFAVWNVAWVAHALVTNPADLYDANIFYPHRQALAFSEANIGAGTLAVPVWWRPRNAVRGAQLGRARRVRRRRSSSPGSSARGSPATAARRRPRRCCSRSVPTSSPTPRTSSC